VPEGTNLVYYLPKEALMFSFLTSSADSGASPPGLETKDLSAVVADSKELKPGDAIVGKLFTTPLTTIFAARSFLRGSFGSQTYRFVLTASTALTSTGAGSFLLFIPLSPAVNSYYEWPALSALFDECKLVKAELTIRPNVGSNGQNLGSAALAFVLVNDVWAGYDCQNINTAPASYASVLRLQGSKPLQRVAGEQPLKAQMIVRPPKGHLWATTAVPAVQSPPSGILGSYSFGNASVMSINTSYYSTVLKVTCDLRCRI